MYNIIIINSTNNTQVFKATVKSLSMANKTIKKVASVSKDPNVLIATITDLSGRVISKVRIEKSPSGKIDLVPID